jgi:hypothetical protein
MTMTDITKEAPVAGDVHIASTGKGPVTEIRGQNGSLIVFGGLRSNPDAIKSLEESDKLSV